MLLNKENKTIKCFECNKWYDIYVETYLHFYYEGSITCPENHLLGNEKDECWKDLFYNKEDLI